MQPLSGLLQITGHEPQGSDAKQRSVATLGWYDAIPLEGVTKSKTRNAKNRAILQIFKEVV